VGSRGVTKAIRSVGHANDGRTVSPQHQRRRTQCCCRHQCPPHHPHPPSSTPPHGGSDSPTQAPHGTPVHLRTLPAPPSGPCSTTPLPAPGRCRTWTGGNPKDPRTHPDSTTTGPQGEPTRATLTGPLLRDAPGLLWVDRGGGRKKKAVNTSVACASGGIRVSTRRLLTWLRLEGSPIGREFSSGKQANTGDRGKGQSVKSGTGKNEGSGRQARLLHQ